MKRVGQGWQPPNEENDDLWKFEFDSIPGAAALLVERTQLEGFDREAEVVVLEDSKTGNRKPVGISFSGAEAENLACDYTEMRETEEDVKRVILEMRGENQ